MTTGSPPPGSPGPGSPGWFFRPWEPFPPIVDPRHWPQGWSWAGDFRVGADGVPYHVPPMYDRNCHCTSCYAMRATRGVELPAEERVVRGFRQYTVKYELASIPTRGYTAALDPFYPYHVYPILRGQIVDWPTTELTAYCRKRDVETNGTDPFLSEADAEELAHVHLSRATCTCGIYGRTVERPRPVRNDQPLVHALVIADGTVAEYTEGWRATHVEIESMEVFVPKPAPPYSLREPLVLDLNEPMMRRLFEQRFRVPITWTAIDWSPSATSYNPAATWAFGVNIPPSTVTGRHATSAPPLQPLPTTAAPAPAPPPSALDRLREIFRLRNP